MQIKTLALATIILLSPQLIFAQSPIKLPSQADLSKWDKKFRVGKYLVEEFQLDAQGSPVFGTSKSKEYCFSQAEIEMVSRAPMLTSLDKNCVPVNVNLTSNSLTAIFSCKSETAGAADEMVQNAVEVSSGYTVESMTVRLNVKSANDMTLLYGAGSKLKRIANCSK